jgi:hypothetical protein
MSPERLAARHLHNRTPIDKHESCDQILAEQDSQAVAQVDAGRDVKLTKRHCPRCTALAFDDLTLEEREDPEKLEQIVVTAYDPEQNFCKGVRCGKKDFKMLMSPPLQGLSNCVVCSCILNPMGQPIGSCGRCGTSYVEPVRVDAISARRAEWEKINSKDQAHTTHSQ